MKLGIRSLKYAPLSQVSDYSMMPPGSSISIDSFITGSLKEIPFTQETAEFSEKWDYGKDGKYSAVTASIGIRAKKESQRATLQALTGRKAVFVLELTSGIRYVIGSTEFPPTFSFSDGISGISSSGFTANISCKSLHGVLLGA